MRNKGQVICAVMVSTLTLASAGSAQAGTYTHLFCQQSPTVAYPAAGFSAFASSNGLANNSCGTATGVLAVGMAGSGPWHAGDGGGFNYSAPVGTTIASVFVTRNAPSSLIARGGAGTGRFAYVLSADQTVLEACGDEATCTDPPAGTFSQSALAASAFSIRLGCQGNFGDVCKANDGKAPQINVSGGAVVLDDETAPVVGNVHGSLTTAGPKTGTVTVSFSAADVGGGLYRLTTFIDGHATASQNLSSDNPTCVDRSGTGARQFSANVPCALADSDLIIPVDTTKLSNGVHEVQVFLEDAAGNTTPLFTPAQKIDVENPTGPPIIMPLPTGGVLGAHANGNGADMHARLKLWFTKNHRTAFTAKFGTRYVIRGQLVDSHGRGITDARVTLEHIIGSHKLLKTGVRTRAQGKITLILPLNLYGNKQGWRSLKFSYTPFAPGKAVTVATLRMRIVNKRGRPVFLVAKHR